MAAVGSTGTPCYHTGLNLAVAAVGGTHTPRTGRGAKIGGGCGWCCGGVGYAVAGNAGVFVGEVVGVGDIVVAVIVQG